MQQYSLVRGRSCCSCLIAGFTVEKKPNSLPLLKAGYIFLLPGQAGNVLHLENVIALHRLPYVNL